LEAGAGDDVVDAVQRPGHDPEQPVQPEYRGHALHSQHRDGCLGGVSTIAERLGLHSGVERDHRGGFVECSMHIELHCIIS
jgi:hypothetical protein